MIRLVVFIHFSESYLLPIRSCRLFPPRFLSIIETSKQQSPNLRTGMLWLIFINPVINNSLIRIRNRWSFNMSPGKKCKNVQ
jgi:hypothetical protein